MKLIFKLVWLFSLLFNPLVAQANWQINLSISDNALKKLNEPLNLELNIEASNSSNADIYMALQLPDAKLLFLEAKGMFTEVNFTDKHLSYAANISNSKVQNGTVVTQLPSDLPTGNYNVYAVATEVGAEVLEQSKWLSPLAKQSFFFVNNTNILPIPPQLTGIVNPQGQKVFELNLQKGQKSFFTRY